jgi:tRNA(Ile)-lysidine synthetase-like protein
VSGVQISALALFFPHQVKSEARRPEGILFRQPQLAPLKAGLRTRAPSLRGHPPVTLTYQNIDVFRVNSSFKGTEPPPAPPKAFMSQALIFKEVVHFFESIVPRLHPAKSVCAAVSGGCDSIALFHVLSALREKLGIARLGIAHVNHRLRGAESDADAAFVKDLSLKAGASFHEKILGPRPRKSGMEDWARQERYTFFNSLCKTEGYDYIATGHTADDQAETVLMRIMRGSGLKGLRAIAPISRFVRILQIKTKPINGTRSDMTFSQLFRLPNPLQRNFSHELPTRHVQHGNCFHASSINGIPYT